MRPTRLIVTAFAVLAFGSPAPAADADGLAFFEAKVRPLLVEHCYKCHSADAEAKNKLRGGLLLDTKTGWQVGGDTGPAVAPGKPAESLLLKSLKYDGELKMPPAGKLPATAIADIEKWIAMGAPDPRATGGAKKQIGMSIEEGRNFWSYKPVADPPLPTVKNAAWPLGPVDRFVLAKLEAKGLAPAADADRATLARRVYFDLVGLPPTPAEVDAFVNDKSPDAYDKLVDRLLASPAFGERWGRHWLDVARYAESVTLRGMVFKEAWRYRDYVIDSFNRDVPFNRFVVEQMAGDLLPAATQSDRERQLVATGFLMLGNLNLEEQDKKQLRMDAVDEQLDVITKGFLAQTVTCARCHDHKFDPIPAKDYYAMAGVLRNVQVLVTANVSNWTEVPLPVAAAAEAELKAHEAKVAALTAKIAAAKKTGAKAAGVLAAADVPGIVVDDRQAKKVGTWQDSTHSGVFIAAGYTHDQDKDKGEKTITFQPTLPADGKYEVRFAYSPGENRSKAVPVTVFSADGEKTISLDMTKPPPLDGRFVSLGTFAFEAAGQSFVIVSNEGTKGHVTADAVTFIPADAAPAAKTKPADKAPADGLKAMEDELKRLQATGPQRPRAMAPVEEKAIEETKVHVRGSVHTLGEPAPRGVLRVALHGPAPAFPKGQSGRKELAEWVAGNDNPLTARVFANRAWHWLFGRGLVGTPDNFGTTGDRPTHPELLDHLATRFVADGWSVKKLVRTLVLSRTYRQAAGSPSPADPENALFGRASRRRLEAENLRDAMLSVSGTLDPARGGPTFPPTLAADYGFKTDSLRRSVYLPLFRNAIPELLDVFDAADVSTVTGKRNAGTVAPQALYMMNSPFVASQAAAAAAKLLAEKLPDDPSRVARAYRLAVGREPTAGERAVALKHVANATGDPKAAWAAVFHALFASADFRYVD